MARFKIEQNPTFKRALSLMESGAPFVFVTGRAGTGKSTLLKHFRETTDLTCAYLAPTGIAALNIEGETIHSFFRFSPGITFQEAIRKGKHADADLYDAIDAIVIDEISMVRADLIDCMDAFLRSVRRKKQPFGGVRIIVIGDLFQLPPVVRTDERAAFADRYETPYFFSSDAIKELVREEPIEYVELDTVYRQRDPHFIKLLNVVRNRSVTGTQLSSLNERVGAKTKGTAAGYIHLTTTNAAADAVNARHLAALPGSPGIFEGKITNGFSEREMPTEQRLELKVGARVMFMKNDPEGRWVNGTLGTVTKLGNATVQVAIDDGDELSVGPVQWTLYRSIFDDDSRSIEQEKIGTFSQLPLRLAWAATIHKSQGKTFDKVIVDLGTGAFAAGQVYVALSRCRTLDGIVLVKPVQLRHLMLDDRVMEFLETLG